MSKDLKYFMRSLEDEIVTAPGPDTFRDEDGNIINFEIKVLSQETIDKINNFYRHRSIATDKKGNPMVYRGEVIWKVEKDNAKSTRHLMVEALQYPDLKDKELMEYYKCYDITDMPLKVFKRSDEYQHVLKIVLQALGMQSDATEEDEVDEAKNS
ncbi:MAG: hypothetical protein LUD01_01350 [Clostridiales bacterium]|nr:hypothetical protein [Clostridiales bacterium]